MQLRLEGEEKDGGNKAPQFTNLQKTEPEGGDPKSGRKLSRQKTHRQLNESKKWHFFLSHYQSTGGDQVDTLCLELQRRGFRCWYDQQQMMITKDAMAEGVRA